MADVPTIIETIGKPRMAAEIGVSTNAVGNALSEESFPAAWYPIVDRLCREHGIDCPLDLFNWASPGRRSRRKVVRAAE